MASFGRGVKKVNEAIMQDGRTIIITEQDDSQLNWDRIPDGTLKVDPVSGQIFIKIFGEAAWIPAFLTYDGNLTIAKDARIVYEVFKIVRANNGDGTFTYEKEDGEQRTKPLTSDGKQAFELEKGSYITRRNKIEAFINDALHRSDTSGGLTEIDETRVALKENKVNGTKITFKYFMKVNIGNPYPRFFINADVPDTADYGDFWLDIHNGMAVLKWWNGNEWQTLKGEEIEELLGGPVIYKGFNVVPGTGRAVTINHGSNGEGVLFINGDRYVEKSTVSNIAITANSTGSTRTDTLYAEVDGNELIYKVRANSTTAPAGTIKLAEIKVANGASSISAGNIAVERKALTIKVISEDIHNSTNLATPSTLVRRDGSGRLRAAAPSHADDVARKNETDALENKKVNRAGDTMTGQLTIENAGLLPKMTAVAATSSGANYPVGITTFNTGTLAGYPIAQAIAINSKVGNTLTQWIYNSSSTTRSFFRHWTGSTWTAFKEVRDLGETSDTAYRGDRGKVAYDHSQIGNANPHSTRHAQLVDVQELDSSSTNATKDKHLSNAQAKKWEDHVNMTSNANPHGTRHADLNTIEGADTSSTNSTQNKHVSNAQAKKWEDHANHNYPHSEHLRAPSNTRIFVQNSRPTGMNAGDIWIDTSVSYGTK